MRILPLSCVYAKSELSKLHPDGNIVLPIRILPMSCLCTKSGQEPPRFGDKIFLEAYTYAQFSMILDKRMTKSYHFI